MLDLLSWLVQSIEQGEWKCPQCGKPIKRENITATGIMKSEKFRNRTVQYIVYDCPECGTKSTITFNRMTVEEYVMDMHEQYHKPAAKTEKPALEETKSEGEETEENKTPAKKPEKKVEPPKVSKITQKEIDDFKKKLYDDCKTHEDFMLYIGLTKEDLDKIKEDE